MTTSTAHSTHLSAESAREHEADFVKALAQADEAIARDMLASRQDLKLSAHILDDLDGLATE